MVFDGAFAIAHCWDARRYLVALELALDAELSFEQIPCV